MNGAAAGTTMTSSSATPEADGEAQGGLADLLNTGRFAEYHLQKAKAALAAGDLATADYQLGASLAHDRLAEAVALRAEVKRRIKAR